MRFQCLPPWGERLYHEDLFHSRERRNSCLSLIPKQLAQTEYDFDYDGQVKGEWFKKIHVRVLPLPEDGIIGTRYSSISFIPFSPFPNTIDIFENNSPIIAEIMRYIGKTNKLSHFPERLHPMNIQFVGINDGILSLVITDIWDVIQSTLESQGFYKEFARETPTLREKVIARVGWLFKIGR